MSSQPMFSESHYEQQDFAQVVQDDNKRKKFPIFITNRAAKQLLYLLNKSGKYIGIRIKVVRGGCSGKKYSIEYVETADKFDEIVPIKYENTIIRIYLDPKVILMIFGTILDYTTSKFDSGFQFINPQEKGRCGCGKSFH